MYLQYFRKFYFLICKNESFAAYEKIKYLKIENFRLIFNNINFNLLVVFMNKNPNTYMNIIKTFNW